jgi:hypothetical protein
MTDRSDDDSSIEEAEEVQEELEQGNDALRHFSRQQLLETIQRLEQEKREAQLHSLHQVRERERLSTIDCDNPLDDVVERKFKSVRDVLEKNLKKFTVQVVFPMKKFEDRESIFKKMCKTAVAQSKVMLPEGCSDTQFAYAFWSKVRRAMNIARQNSVNAARIKFIGKEGMSDVSMSTIVCLEKNL